MNPTAKEIGFRVGAKSNGHSRKRVEMRPSARGRKPEYEQHRTQTGLAPALKGDVHREAI